MSLALLSKSLKKLSQETGIEHSVHQDGVGVTLRWSEQAHDFSALIHRHLQEIHLSGLAEKLSQLKSPLLITQHVSSPLAEKLRLRGICFVDASGNSYLKHDHLLVFVHGRSPPPKKAIERGLSPTVWQVAFVLLRDPSSHKLPVRPLGKRAGVSHVSAANALHALEARGWIRRLGRHGVAIIDPDALISAWEMGYVDRLVSKLTLTNAVPGHSTLQQWATTLTPIKFNGSDLLGGELAAQLLGLDIIASTATVHVSSWDAETMRRLRLIPSPKGPVRVLRAFGSRNPSRDLPHFADPLLIRGELLLIPDERLNSARSDLLTKVRELEL